MKGKLLKEDSIKSFFEMYRKVADETNKSMDECLHTIPSVEKSIQNKVNEEKFSLLYDLIDILDLRKLYGEWYWNTSHNKS